LQGANIKNLLNENTLIGDNNRFISGDVLTGEKIEEDGNIGFYDSQLTVIEEGNQQEFLGWIAPNLDKFLSI
jgi:Na+-transporting NADH:ubiquinone oxidoreductase subunit A